MRRLLAAILLGLALVGAARAEGIDQVYQKPAGRQSWGELLAAYFGHPGYARSYALVVGISAFADFRDLPTAQDAIRVKDFLIDEAGFDRVHLLTEDKVTYQRLRELMEDELPAFIDANDRFLLYWSGHGTTRSLPGGGQRGYLPLGQSQAGQFSGMVSMDNIRGWDGNLRAEQVLYLLDACFSGLAGSAPKAVTDYQRLRIDQLARPGRHLLTAGTESEETIALDSLGGSVFTAAVLDGLRGAADASSAFPNDGLVSVSELELYVNERVLRERIDANWQRSITPQLRDLGTSNGEFFFITGDRLSSAPDDTVDTSDTGPDERVIVEAQEILAGLGYDPGPRDGILGLRTQGALRRFQVVNGLPVTGALDEATLPALVDAWAAKPRAIVAGEATVPEAVAKGEPTAEVPRGATRLVGTGQSLLTNTERDPSHQPGDRFRDCAECPEMVVVPAGSFTMGSPAGEEGRYTDEGPEHRVTIAGNFAVGMHEVTRGQFAAFVEATGYDAGNGCYAWESTAWQLDDVMSWRWPGFAQTDDQAVVCVSWEDATAYVEWLEDETLEPYRLLSEAEWEYAARAGARTRYWWGDDIDDHRANFGNTMGGTTPVGAFAANAFGLLDVHGNAGEWVKDCYHDSYDVAGRPDDGGAWTSGDCSRRVLRGGSWFDGPRAQRSAYRDGNEPDYRVDGGGFRVGRTLR